MAEPLDNREETALNEADLHPDPIEQFRRWFADAQASGNPQPDAMTLATATPDGQPSARIVLLKACDERGFVFFTNYDSRKGQELAANPRAALVLHWPELTRQVRIEGSITRASAAESDAYFEIRPWGSRLGAAASPQSQVIASRDALEARVHELEARHPIGNLSRPAFWGGYRLMPVRLELWQGRRNRLHDRLCYARTADGRWLIQRLAP